jgi:L-ribulose-5-phosphate 4-epimerase
MTERSLREQCFEANLAIQRAGLVILTWGNASVCDRERGVIVIKPSGVPYAELSPANMVIVELDSGRVAGKGKLRPSSDTPTHLALYREFEGVGGIVHTHSRQATIWAQAGRDLPCFGTTHADYFFGAVPCTAAMTSADINNGLGYEHNTGGVIIHEFARRRLDPLAVPAVLVRQHAPFAWGATISEAIRNAIVLEEIAGMASQTLAVNPRATPISSTLLRKHFQRKHGPGAYYGQNSNQRVQSARRSGMSK